MPESPGDNPRSPATAPPTLTLPLKGGGKRFKGGIMRAWEEIRAVC